jgi:uncharacterized protein (TIGR02246 family)
MEASVALRSRFSSLMCFGVVLACLAPAAAAGQGIKRPTTPVRTARDELRAFREDYQEAYNKKDSVTVAGMYASDAIVINADGTVLSGQDAIQKAIYANAKNWSQLTITSDSLRVVGSTAWDVGTTRRQLSEGGEQVSHYLTVLRRGVKYWKLSRLALVPESRAGQKADSTGD